MFYGDALAKWACTDKRPREPFAYCIWLKGHHYRVVSRKLKLMFACVQSYVYRLDVFISNVNFKQGEFDG